MMHELYSHDRVAQVRMNDFLSVAYTEIPRLLGQLNRNPSSVSYGSFDRAYWHYRTNDISSARYQEAVYTLTLLYVTDFEGNEYYKDARVLEWIRATLRFTATIQRSNGSFDEWYVNEGSYVATAFVTAAFLQAVRLLQEVHPELPELVSTERLLKRSARFLSESREETVLNQVSGALFATLGVGHFYQDTELEASSEKLLTQFLSQQNKEGWWSEYGGPDIGYLSLTINYLEKCQMIRANSNIQDAVRKAKGFLEQFINPDMTGGGEYMSRNTEYLIPSVTLPYLGAITPQNLDDRYLCYILYNWIETGVKIPPQEFLVTKGETYFPLSGLLRVVNDNFFLVVNLMKGGSFRLYRDGAVYYDSGIEIAGKGRNLGTGVLDSTNQIKVQGNKYQVSGYAKLLREPLLQTATAVIFKSWQVLFGRLSPLQKFVKDFLRRHMVSSRQPSSLSFERSISYDTGSICIIDTVNGLSPQDAILFGTKSAYTAVPSSKYVHTLEFSRPLLTVVPEEIRGDTTYTLTRLF